MSAILAIVVMHDAMNVRLESGKQAHLLNVNGRYIREGDGEDLPNDKKLMSFSDIHRSRLPPAAHWVF